MGTKLWDRIAARMGLRASVEAVPARLVVSGPVEPLQAELEPTAEGIEQEYQRRLEDLRVDFENRRIDLESDYYEWRLEQLDALSVTGGEADSDTQGADG